MSRHSSFDDLQGARPDPRAPDVIRLRQSRQAQFRAVVGEAPAILRVESGVKFLRGAIEGIVPEGALTLMPADLPLDVENRPAPGGIYRATGLVLPRDVGGPRGTATAVACTDPRALAAFERALDLQRSVAAPPSVRLHAAEEVLLWLAETGLVLPPPRPPLLTERIRMLCAEAIDRDWTASEVARRMAMSEATLRRRLAADGTTFSVLLTDLRMTRALGLLQTTDRPVGTIAAEVGYASASRFALRFRDRFGLSPSAIRERPDRLGTEVDRVGTTEVAPAI
ncbi:helix-turn-helix transcriptional regulator [Tabrizicola sp. J26]|uniref:helix-turn-helix transcriptional regulator n=1 Tax=Alitabrizicola rongguiensis TaxID=2909234 RepID=UPI001F429C00|nr:helix-turn-helix transcriptional regulator [Tabrizicola rongguiensis]MCF1707213.1 helix-turn-helix transcriptional regulator [Tabrizicola rongguiensis]